MAPRKPKAPEPPEDDPTLVEDDEDDDQDPTIAGLAAQAADDEVEDLSPHEPAPLAPQEGGITFQNGDWRESPDATTGRPTESPLWKYANQDKGIVQLDIYRIENGVPVNVGQVDQAVSPEDFIRTFLKSMPGPAEGKTQFIARPIDNRGNRLPQEFPVLMIDGNHVALQRIRREQQAALGGNSPTDILLRETLRRADEDRKTAANAQAAMMEMIKDTTKLQVESAAKNTGEVVGLMTAVNQGAIAQLQEGNKAVVQTIQASTEAERNRAAAERLDRDAAAKREREDTDSKRKADLAEFEAKRKADLAEAEAKRKADAAESADRRARDLAEAESRKKEHETFLTQILQADRDRSDRLTADERARSEARERREEQERKDAREERDRRDRREAEERKEAREAADKREAAREAAAARAHDIELKRIDTAAEAARQHQLALATAQQGMSPTNLLSQGAGIAAALGIDIKDIAGRVLGGAGLEIDVPALVTAATTGLAALGGQLVAAMKVSKDAEVAKAAVAGGGVHPAMMGGVPGQQQYPMLPMYPQAPAVQQQQAAPVPVALQQGPAATPMATPAAPVDPSASIDLPLATKKACRDALRDLGKRLRTTPEPEWGDHFRVAMNIEPAMFHWLKGMSVRAALLDVQIEPPIIERVLQHPALAEAVPAEVPRG